MTEPHSHRSLWTAIVLLALVNLVQGAFLLAGALFQTPDGSGPNQVAVRQETDISERDIAFDQARLDEIQQGRAPWLEEFFRANDVSVDKADVSRGAIVRYMMSVNEVRVMEARGLHEGDRSYRFYNVERSRLVRSLQVALDRDVAARLDVVLAENGIIWPPPKE